MAHAKILLVQSGDSDTVRLEACLRDMGYTVCATVPSGRLAIEQAAALRPGLALVDLGLEGEVSGVEVAEQIGRLDVPVVCLTDDAEERLWQRAGMTQPYGYVLKPVVERQLHLNIQTALVLHGKEMARREHDKGLRQDIDELQRTHRTLDTILDHMQEGVAITDAAGHLVFANAKAEQLIDPIMRSDANSGEWSGTSEESKAWGVFEPDRQTSVPAYALPLVRALQGMDTDDKEVFVRNTKKPHGAYVNLVGRTLWSKDKQEIEGTVVFFLETSLARKTEETEARMDRTMAHLRDDGSLLGTVFDSVDDGLIICDTTGQPLYFNRRARQLLKLAPEWPNPGPAAWAEKYGLFCPDKETHLPLDQNPLVRAIQGEATSNLEVVVRNEDAPEGRYLRGGGRPLWSGDGEVKAGVVVFRDITKDKQAEARLQQTVNELRNQSQILSMILNSIRDGVVAADGAGRVLFVNSQAEQLVGPVDDMQPGELHDASARQKKHGLFELDKETYVPTDQLPLVRALLGKPTDDMEVFICNEHKPDGAYVSIVGRTLWGNDNKEIDGGVVFFRDITKEKEAGLDLQRTISELRDQTQLMEAVFESMNEAIFVASKDGKVIWANSRTEQIIGVGAVREPPDEWPRVYGIYYPDQETMVPSDQLATMRVLRGEQIDEVEQFIRNEKRPEGVYVSVNGRPLRDTNHEITASVVVFRDITRNKRIEDRLEQTILELRAQTELMRTVFDSMEEGVVVADVNGDLMLTNARREQIIGTKLIASEPADWPATFGAFHLHPDKVTHFPTEQLPLVRAMRGQATDDIELFIRSEARPDGAYIRARGRPLFDSYNELRAGVAIFSDITQYKQTEIALEKTITDLQNQGELMEATLNGINEGIAVAGPDGTLLSVNPAARHIIGLEMMQAPQTEMGEKWGTYYYPDRQTRIKTEDLPLYRAVFHGESTDEIDIYVRNEIRPEGFYVRVSARPLLNAAGGVRGGVIIFRDVTEQMLAEEALTRAFAQGRLEMIDTILHNVGNAINSVTIGIDTVHQNLANDRLLDRLRALADAIKAHQDDWLDYVEHDPQGQKVMPFIIALAEDFARQNEGLVKTVERVKDRANHIADIVRTQKLSGGSMDRKDIDLKQALSAAVRVLHDSLQRWGVTTDIDCANAPQEIRIQESHFHQMMVNLIKNALEAIKELVTSGRFEEAPRIQLRAYVKDNFFHIDVNDNGVGIGNKNVKMLFTAGYTTKKSGSGLGLHSVANFVAGAGGQVYALSDGIGRGATVGFKLSLSSVTPVRGGGGGGAKK